MQRKNGKCRHVKNIGVPQALTFNCLLYYIREDYMKKIIALLLIMSLLLIGAQTS